MKNIRIYYKPYIFLFFIWSDKMVMIIDVNKYPTITKLKEAIQSKQVITIEDPSIINPRIFTTNDMERGETVIVTNHPKRSYFVKIVKDVDGTLKLKK